MSASEVVLAKRLVPLVAGRSLSKLYEVRRGVLFRKQEVVHALTDVSLVVRSGETLGVVGESGSGKSTLGRVLLRLVEPSFGTIEFDGVDITRLAEREMRQLRKRMQIVFQDPSTSLNPRMTVREIVGEGLVIGRTASGAALEERVRAELERVGLDASALERYPHEFSGGQRQRIAIARALAVEPSFVVCDEPVSSLDVSVQAQIVNLLEEVQCTAKVAYLFISHDLRLVEYLSHRIAVMYLGRIVETGPASELSAHPLHPYTHALFDASPRLPGRGEPKQKRLRLAGEPPSPSAPPPGCAFHPRCPRAVRGRCDVEVPPLAAPSPGSSHQVACFFPE